jgi:hypothetical protein
MMIIKKELQVRKKSTRPIILLMRSPNSHFFPRVIKEKRKILVPGAVDAHYREIDFRGALITINSGRIFGGVSIAVGLLLVTAGHFAREGSYIIRLDFSRFEYLKPKCINIAVRVTNIFHGVTPVSAPAVTNGDIKKAMKVSPVQLIKGPDRHELKRLPNAQSKDFTPVVMAVWSRPENLETTISDLLKQKEPVHLYLWLNKKSLFPRVKKIINKNGNKSKIGISIYVSDVNIGGFGRFFAARDLAKKGYDRVVFIDDDQRIGKEGIKSLLDGINENRSITGSWSFLFAHPDNYWIKERILKGRADYVGTGGMAATTEVFLSDGLFSEIPKEYWFIEDLWLSWYAYVNCGYELGAVDADIKVEKDGKDQMSRLIDTKSEFFRHLTELGAPWSERINKHSNAYIVFKKNNL